MNREEAIIILTNVASLLRYGTRYMKPEHEKQFREAYEMAIKALEQEQPALTKGKWIVYEVANDEDEHPIAWECDACGAVVDCKTRFCPECGQEKEV